MKRLLSVLLVTIAVLLPTKSWAADGVSEPYAVLSENNTVLTFYYDDQKEARNGMSVGPFTSESQRGWNGNTSITHVVFDSSFANCSSITSTRSWFSNNTGITSITGIEYLNTENVTDMAYMFNYCRSLEALDLSAFKTSKVTDMGYMFNFCSSLKSLNIRGLNTANVTNMGNMFHACYILSSIDLSSFDTSNVTDMSYMFERCDSLRSLDLENFQTPNVTDMHRMFYQCYSLANLNISNFNTEKVKTMNNMFGYCSALQNIDLSSFSTVNVENMSDMFARCTSLVTLDLSSFNTSKVSDMDALFYLCSSLTTIYVGNAWTTDAVKTAQGDNVFYQCTNLVGGAGTTFDENHTDHTYAHIDGGTANPGYFTDKNATPAVVEPYAVLSADSLTVTFYYDDQRTARGGIDINTSTLYEGTTSPYGTATTAVIDASFEGYRPTSTARWFMKCSSLTSISGIENLNTENVTDMSDMFHDCSVLASIDVSHFNTANVTLMRSMFLGCSSLTTLDLSSFNTEKVEDMGMMFQYCYNLAELNLSSFNTSNVTSFFQMFLDCRSLKNLDITHFNTANVRSMRWMFGLCFGLQRIDLSHFDTRNVQDMGEMFYNDYGLPSLDLSNFNTENLTNMWCMFKGCRGLTTLDISNFNTDKVTYMQELFQNCTSLQHINMGSFNTAKVEEFRDMFDNCSSLASIQVGNAAIPDSIYADIENPNLLVYVNEAALAPSGVQNVVVNGQAREIVLTDATSGNNNFYVPQAFTAERISYTRNFTQSTQIGVSRGWESIALPFDVQSITHETKGTIAPFGNSASNRHFWLRELGSNGLQPATGIAANTPYVISMPNSADYTDNNNLAGRVTFAAENATIPVTEVKASAMGDQSIVMIPTMQRVDRSSEVWALNVGEVRGRYLEGSVFERDYREVRPFEAYTVHRQENSQPAPRYVPLQEIGGTTGIHSVESGELSTEKWYDLNGRQLQGKPNAKGVYINNGQKIVIR